MKKLYVFAVLLLSFIGTAQPEKDSLLAKDHDKVLVQLNMMRYLDSICTQNILKTSDGKVEVFKSFYRFYLDTIAGRSPAGFRATADFLGYEGTRGPMSWREFNSRAAKRNIETMMKLIVDYGYIDAKRIGSAPFKKHVSFLTYIAKDNSYDDKLKPLLQKEFEIGNISEHEYDMFKSLIKRKRVLTKRDIKNVEKSGAKMIMKKV
jgi:hypothetical protein